MSMKMIRARSIMLGQNVYIGPYCRIEGVEHYAGIHYSPQIKIEDRVTIQQGLHLTCANLVEIGRNTSISAYVTITDIHHSYEDICIPIEKQPLEVKKVSIGTDCKIYNGVVILPGCHIGNHVTIGANSVVNCDLPDYCVAAGAPCRILKRYNPETKIWEKTDKKGIFLN